MVEFMFIKIQCFQHILLNTCWQMSLKYENYSLRRMEVLDIQTTLTQQKPHCKNSWWNYNKNESCKPYLGNKEQKWLLLVVSLSDLHINYYFACTLFLACPIGHANKMRAQKIGRVDKFVQPYCFWPFSYVYTIN